jgi:hypothetical protein
MQGVSRFSLVVALLVSAAVLMVACGAPAEKPAEKPKAPESVKIILLHHSTGNNIWNGGVPQWIEKYNADHGTVYQITERNFPSGDPYKWKNYPFDYWNIWVEHAGSEPYMEEPTLEILTKQYDVIAFKHCYPVSNIKEDTGSPDISSEVKSIENYVLQYEALKEKLRSYPETKFIVWTGAALVEKNTSEENAQRARKFFDWVKSEWDEPGDNIYIWDLFEIETEGGLYLKVEYAAAEDNSHPNEAFSQKAAPLFARTVVDVIEGKAD